MKKLIIPLLVAAALLAGCSDTSQRKDAQVANDQLGQYLQAQPVPVFKWSQERATMIAIINARATTTATTTFFFNQGVKDPIMSCPSIGYPIASSTQLTNPDTEVGGQGAVVAQIDPPGVYTGDSTGTYVLCTASSGTRYPFYWEGFVATVGGDAVWDSAKGEAVMQGEPTVKVETKK